MKKINKYLIFSFLVAFITLLITSKNSFLYLFNDWVDANSFFTVGKSMFNGLVVYKDIFEQNYENILHSFYHSFLNSSNNTIKHLMNDILVLLVLLLGDYPIPYATF